MELLLCDEAGPFGGLDVRIDRSTSNKKGEKVCYVQCIQVSVV